jgi:hypothetical protein
VTWGVGQGDCREFEPVFKRNAEKSRLMSQLFKIVFIYTVLEDWRPRHQLFCESTPFSGEVGGGDFLMDKYYGSPFSLYSHQCTSLFYSTIIVQKSRVFPTLFCSNYFHKASTLLKDPSLFHENRIVSKERDFSPNYFEYKL